MRTSCHVTSAWTGDGSKITPWRPQFIVDHPESAGFEYDMLSGDPRTDPQTPCDLVVRCLNDTALNELLADVTYPVTEVCEYCSIPWPEVSDPLW